jgi:hypothetical protein
MGKADLLATVAATFKGRVISVEELAHLNDEDTDALVKAIYATVDIAA